MAVSPEVQERFAVLRQKARDNTLTKEEMMESITLLRGDRTAASGISAASKAKKSTAAAKKLPINSDDLLSELEDL